MAMTKRTKIQTELEKARLKLVEQQTRIKELEAKNTELENMEIVEIVRGMDISLDDLATVMQSLKGSYIPTLSATGQLDPQPAISENDKIDKEDEN